MESVRGHNDQRLESRQRQQLLRQAQDEALRQHQLAEHQRQEQINRRMREEAQRRHDLRQRADGQRMTEHHRASNELAMRAELWRRAEEQMRRAREMQKQSAELNMATEHDLPQTPRSSGENIVRQRTEERLRDLELERQKQESEQRIREQVLTTVLPKLERRANLCGDDPVRLLREFCPTMRVAARPTAKQLDRAYKKVMTKFHPDRTARFPLAQRIEAEEIFKILSSRKDRILNSYGSRYGGLSAFGRPGFF